MPVDNWSSVWLSHFFEPGNYCFETLYIDNNAFLFGYITHKLIYWIIFSNISLNASSTGQIWPIYK